MRIVITKGRGEDRVEALRADGSAVSTCFPKKGPAPHDAVHWFVERELGLRGAFWGMIAGGRHPEEIAGIAKAAGHASASRARRPDAAIVELLQAERLVECFEAELWTVLGGGTADDAALLAIAATACESAHVPMPAVPDGAADRIRRDLAAFVREWMAAPEGYAAHFEW